MRLMSSASTPPCSPRSGATPPTTLVPPPNGTTASESSRAQLQQRPQLLVAAGIHDRVGRALGLARAQAHEVRIALAGGVQHALGVLRRARARRRRSRAAPRALPAERARRGRRTRSSATGGRGRAASPTVSRRKPSACAGSAGAWRGSPQPHQRIAGGPLAWRAASATDPLEPVERLVERRRGGAAHQRAAEARARLMNGLWRAEPLASSWRSSIVPRSRRRSPARACRGARSRSSVSAELSTLANGVPSTRCTHVSVRASRRSARRSRRARVCPCASSSPR